MEDITPPDKKRKKFPELSNFLKIVVTRKNQSAELLRMSIIFPCFFVQGH